MKAPTVEQIIARLDRLYDTYVEGGTEEARRALREAESLIASSGDTNLMNQGLYLTYARLYCVEHFSGRSNLAAIYLTKARYWYVRDLESVGKPVDEIASGLRELSAEKIASDMLEWDLRRTNGRGPQYLRDAPAERLAREAR